MEKVLVTKVWDFGGFESEAEMTKDEFWAFINQGERDGDIEVTSIFIFTPTTPEYQRRWGALPAIDGRLQNEVSG